MTMYIKEEQFTDKQTGDVIAYQQIYVEVDGISVPVKPTFKNDRRLLLCLAKTSEGKEK